jgi:hypothetical protein
MPLSRRQPGAKPFAVSFNSDGQIRFVGLTSMLIGLILLIAFHELAVT